ncbi:hypothetical protein RUM43_004555 [Polyplax serrata]|uniref:Uncharacterized protein n=1 Tax=Polyplax serrata TaxID=468196 RepID=A0AAN8SB29_POLSC
MMNRLLFLFIPLKEIICFRCSSPRRKLLYFLEKSDKLDEMLQQRYQNKTPHRVRHEKKIRRLTEIQVKEKTNSSSRRETNDISDVRQETTIDDNIRVFLKSVNNKTMKWFKWSENATKNGSTNLSAKDQVLHEKLEVHQNCYTMNDVLEIIAVTCLVNFIFWFMIITCVNVFTRNQKISKSDR